ncbi:MAG: hypothetical protein R3E82_16725 [Pseudomonadales bacterium]
MTKPSKVGVWTGAATLVSSLALLPALPATAAEEIEEVVVTGSYIKRDSFDSSSPITVVDQAAIADNATPNLGEVMVNQTFNYGTDFQTNTYAARAQAVTSVPRTCAVWAQARRWTSLTAGDPLQAT